MEFSIVSEFEIIEEASKAANRLLLASPAAEITVNQQFAAGQFQIPDSFR